MLTVLLVIIAIGVVVFVHELGHFMIAKKFGVKVEKFSLGFGPEWFGFTRSGTRYCVSMIPFGGFVKMAGDNIFEHDKVKPGDFLWTKWYKRILIALAGPLMNFLFAIMIFSILIILTGILYPKNEPVIGDVLADLPAYNVGMQSGDIVKSINDQEVKTWDDITRLLSREKDKKIKFSILRENESLIFDVMPVYNQKYDYYMVGIAPEVEVVKLGFFKSIWHGIKYVFFMVVLFIKSLFLILTGKLKAELMGPVGVAHSLGIAAKSGMYDFVNLLGIISINLCLINLLPFPMLDGGHIFFFLVEGIRRKPVSKEIFKFTYAFGIVLLLVLMVIATKQDITRIFLNS